MFTHPCCQTTPNFCPSTPKTGGDRPLRWGVGRFAAYAYLLPFVAGLDQKVGLSCVFIPRQG
ncbi:hypothetical protein D9623_21655 [Azospirillum brasilense]|uniref:Uncharacterized protein n=1 Tax=Azospirillum brasilense TaxID=192 RepID=A0A4D8QQI6_AZOBR|nr:hypothetical protein [Azospirillum brasilense]NUB23434.1 hypothetical protein [Azospirillum brasilense]NUB30028.1 hypothetical protein [Azospirillum brasilense]QCO11126.1 hypothetical protein D3868_19095 [Azospirillum brasilense]QEL92625.1 hypothetical protein D9621_21350 [Azospirillum brasilense]